MRMIVWLLMVLLQLIRSLFIRLTRRLYRTPQPTNFYSSPPIDCPVVLVPGNMGDVSTTAAKLNARGVHAIDPSLGPVSSSHDRACELFYSLVGGRIDYGVEHSKLHGHDRFGRLRIAQHSDWSSERPVILLCHSQGSSTSLALLDLLARRAFPGYATSPEWIRGVCAIASPLSGISWIHTLPLIRVPPPSSPSKREQRICPLACQLCGAGVSDYSEESEPHQSQFAGSGLAALMQILGYVMHILTSWSEYVTDHVWDWRLDHWRLSLSDLLPLVTRRHRLLHTTDMALYDLTPAGASMQSTGCHKGVFYVALTCQVTLPSSPYEDKENLAPIPSHEASPFHVCAAAIGSAFAVRPCCRHSDGLVPTCAQRCPPRQPSCTLASLNPSCEEDDESARFLALAKELRPGLWCSGREPWPLDHSASHLRVGSATTEFALRVVLPAMCRLAASE